MLEKMRKQAEYVKKVHTIYVVTTIINDLKQCH